MKMGSDLSRRAESARLASAPAHQSFQFRPLRSPVRNCDTARAASRTGAARECARRALAARKSGNRRRGPAVGTSVAIVPRAHRGRAAAQRSEIPTESHHVLPEVGGHRGPSRLYGRRSCRRQEARGLRRRRVHDHRDLLRVARNRVGEGRREEVHERRGESVRRAGGQGSYRDQRGTESGREVRPHLDLAEDGRTTRTRSNSTRSRITRAPTSTATT